MHAMTDTNVRLSDNELRLLVEACRSLASRYSRDADYERDPVVRRVLIEGATELSTLSARLQEISDRIRAARFKPEPEPEPPPSNVRKIRS
jgi:hypothetical protein